MSDKEIDQREEEGATTHKQVLFMATEPDRA